MWYKNLEYCQQCKSNERPHYAKGLCKRCYKKQLVPLRWSKVSDACLICGKSDSPHQAYGLCGKCYNTRPQEDKPCECGCGLPTSWYRGKPRRFRKGHWLKAQGTESEFQKAHIERFTGENNPCYGLYGKDHPAYGNQMPESAKDSIRQAKLESMSKRYEKRTNIELILAQLLGDLGIKHISQHIIANKFVVDEYLPDHNVIIEAWGDFWHANPAKFPVSTLTFVQQKIVKKDSSRLKYLKKCGFTVLTFWENDLKGELDKCKEVLLRALENHRC